MINKVNQESYAIIIRMLLEEPQGFNALQEATGLHRGTLYRLFQTFRKHRIAHICDWEPDSLGRDAFPVYALGKGRDKDRYRMSRAEIARRYRERKKGKDDSKAINNAIMKVAA